VATGRVQTPKRAFRILAAKTAEIVDLPTPEPGPGEALVKVHVCGLCGSDLHAYEGTQPFFRYPEIPGHEMVGEIVAIGPPRELLRLPNRPIDEPWRIGDRVTLDPAMPCGHCFPCRTGRYNCCVNLRVLSVHAPGALAEFFVAPLECLFHVPDALDDEIASLAEPVSIGCEANNRGRIGPDDTVAIIGAGAIGLCVQLVAQARGARVIACDLSPERLAFAAKLGAFATVNAGESDAAARIAELTGGDGPSVVVEAVGKPATIRQALDLVAASGRVVLLGLCRDEVTIPGSVMVRKELDFLGSRLHGGTFPQALNLIATSAVDPRPLITHRLPLDRTEEALKLMAEHPGDIVKATLNAERRI
jgi:threonine dehydrogenase-like Zn-dependent dehydrogenase